MAELDGQAVARLATEKVGWDAMAQLMHQAYGKFQLPIIDARTIQDEVKKYELEIKPLHYVYVLMIVVGAFIDQAYNKGWKGGKRGKGQKGGNITYHMLHIELLLRHISKIHVKD